MALNYKLLGEIFRNFGLTIVGGSIVGYFFIKTPTIYMFMYFLIMGIIITILGMILFFITRESRETPLSKEK